MKNLTLDRMLYIDGKVSKWSCIFFMVYLFYVDFIFKNIYLMFSVTVGSQYYFILVSGVQHSG